MGIRRKTSGLDAPAYAQREEQSRLEAAAGWRMRIEIDPALEHSSDYLAWSAEPAHQAAMDDMLGAWNVFDEHGAMPDVAALRQAAVARAQHAAARRRTLRIAWVRAVGIGMMVAALGAGTIAYLQQPAVYSTAIGERRTVALEDGSRITLDSDTELHVRYSRDARRLTLDRGRARFDVAHDASRPFTVDAGQEAVTALGTSFDVERIRAKVLVMLFEGRLAVSGTAAGQPTISLAAGQRLSVTGDGTPAIAQANLKAAAAWQNGMLVFNDDTLDEAAARMNRYAARPVEIDPSLAALRISGVFKAGDVDAFVEAVTSFFPVQAIPRAGSGILILPRG